MNQYPHPQVAEAFKQLELIQEALTGQLHRGTENRYVGNDEDKTVEVTVDGDRTLTGLFIEDGLLRLGPETVGERINEALQMAQAAALAATREQQAQLFADLNEYTNTLKSGLGLR